MLYLFVEERQSFLKLEIVFQNMDFGCCKVQNAIWSFLKKKLFSYLDKNLFSWKKTKKKETFLDKAVDSELCIANI